MIQPLKTRAVKDAAISALDLLFKQLKTYAFHFNDSEIENPVTTFSGAEIQSTDDRKSVGPSASAKTASLSVSLTVKKPINLDPFANCTYAQSHAISGICFFNTHIIISLYFFY
jgi:hypothetical protein